MTTITMAETPSSSAEHVSMLKSPIGTVDSVGDMLTQDRTHDQRISVVAGLGTNAQVDSDMADYVTTIEG